ncbi:MAG: zinc metalloprotease HtpX [Acidobacteria bacterium]|nr:zinc metalloprotease HtpX [Acidobacteriota bacterium]
MNGIKTVLLLGTLSGVLLMGGRALGGQQGLVIALGLAVVMNFASYFFSDKIALSMYRAQPVTRSANTQVYARIGPMTEELCRRMGLPMPKLWVIPDHSPNAFATGRNPKNASVAVTAGLLELMNDRELEGVIAHELGHVKHRDILISSIAATMGAAISSLAHIAMLFGGRRHDDEDSSPLAGLAMLIVAPFAAMLIQMAISRTREYSADAAAAKYTGSPDGLISGLQKLESFSRRIPMDASPATAHMFIIKPFSGMALASLFSTHPPTEKRVAALAALRGEPTWTHSMVN